MSQTFLTKSGCKGANLEPIALVGHDAVLTRGRRSTKEGGALLTKAVTLVPLSDVIKEKCKNKKFAKLFQRELLINEISCMVVKLRQRSRMTQQELADKAGTTQPVVARLESGSDSRIPSLDLLTRLAIAADATIKFAVSYNGSQLHKHC